MSTTDTPSAEPNVQEPVVRTAAVEGPNWQEQDGLLRDMWMDNQTPAAIGQALNRSVPAVMTRAARLGLPRRFAPGRKPGRRPIENSAPRTDTNRSSSSTIVEAENAEAATQVSPRICLMCLTKFQSMGRHNRICPTCKHSAEYESGSRLPDLDFPVGDA